jgi:Tfp pilus assembly protein PilF
MLKFLSRINARGQNLESWSLACPFFQTAVKISQVDGDVWNQEGAYLESINQWNRSSQLRRYGH